MYPLGNEYRENSRSVCRQSSLASIFSDDPSGQTNCRRVDSTPYTFCLRGEKAPSSGWLHSYWGALGSRGSASRGFLSQVSSVRKQVVQLRGAHVWSILRGEHGTKYWGDTLPIHLLVQLLPLANHSRPPLAPHLLLNVWGGGGESHQIGEFRRTTLCSAS